MFNWNLIIYDASKDNIECNTVALFILYSHKFMKVLPTEIFVLQVYFRVANVLVMFLSVELTMNTTQQCMLSGRKLTMKRNIYWVEMCIVHKYNVMPIKHYRFTINWHILCYLILFLEKKITYYIFIIYATARTCAVLNIGITSWSSGKWKFVLT